MSKIYLKKYLILVSLAFIAFIAIFLYLNSGRFLFGNILFIPQTTNIFLEKKKPDFIGFYSKLSKEKGGFSIIEYPAIIQDRYAPVHYYQSLHRKKVLNGYFLSHALKKEWKNNIFKSDVWPVEIIISCIENNKLNISKTINATDNFIDLYSISSIKKSGANYVILHKDIEAEILALKNGHTVHKGFNKSNGNEKILEHINKFTSHFKSYYTRYFGNPVYEDKYFIVFNIK